MNATMEKLASQISEDGLTGPSMSKEEAEYLIEKAENLNNDQKSWLNAVLNEDEIS